MNNITRILILIFCLAGLSSCEEIIDLNLKPSEPKDVINASISPGQPCMVILSKSQDFNDNSPYDYISNAYIELTDNEGNSEVLRESIVEPGFYFSMSQGVVNRTYTLKVTIDEKNYEATATIPNPVEPYRIYIYDIKVGNEHWYSPCVVFDDPADEDNYYYTIVYVNGNLMNTFYLDDDKYRNGVKGVENILFFNDEDNNDEELKAGDHIRVDMQTLDKGMYDYYNTLTSVVEGTNPTTNISGGAYGNFKAYNTSTIEMTISETDIPQ